MSDMDAAETPVRGPGDHFLAWFDYDRERASDNLDRFRPRLASFFSRKGCRAESDDLTQDVIHRTIEKFNERYPDREPRPYLFRVARFVYLEWTRSHMEVPLPAGFDIADPAQQIETFLTDESCTERVRAAFNSVLKGDDRELFFSYLKADTHGKAQIALRRGSSLNALRVKIATLKRKLILEVQAAYRM